MLVNVQFAKGKRLNQNHGREAHAFLCYGCNNGRLVRASRRLSQSAQKVSLFGFMIFFPYYFEEQP